MRLGTCIALELAAFVGAIGGLLFGVGHAIDSAGTYFTTHEAAAATYAPTAALPARLPNAQLDVVPQPPAAAPHNVFGASDDALLAPIAAAPVVRVKPNYGGTSLSLRIDFANGSRAAFKPEQIHPQSNPRREIAAYRMDRLLGIGHVAPAKAVAFTVAELVAAADPGMRNLVATRLAEEGRARGGTLRGMVAWWIPDIRDARLDGIDLHEGGMRVLVADLQIGAVIPPHHRVLVEQLATCIVFDVIIDNADRWTGSNTKVSPDQQTLYFMDNTLSFSTYRHGHDGNLKPLLRIQVFPRALIERLRALTLESVRAALDLGTDDAGLGPLLDDDAVRAIISRRNHLLEYVDALIEVHGEDAVLALP